MAATVIPVTGASGIFEGMDMTASFSGELIDHTSCVDADFASTGDGTEVAFNICDHLYSEIDAQVTSGPDGANKVRVGTSSTLSGSTLTKTYTFTFDLGFTDVGSLNVVDE
jgi:hypothetical protein